ncbi:exosome non-catalytic core subunit RRP46 NDAI_0G01250 [Naumovozyma dairenensis CBS 421]|uniref:Uncharacterized protein n=1 Tax=Naumovozyma dairenensis (strain ATCC 10597 / BCRC 20456 / CBS 421 / NBRC 0211 / NRRL Y-12639) TaxID=1071378 RepID=G0WDP0_NAUDC|nr:hypothetical protein NDAI_0G01250 [Naumovozyma dairenensis CBS 421]CCD25901.2 hypothetical protein NDAI_0G01250 [Naumovozyma dairenensis CBS 421]
MSFQAETGILTQVDGSSQIQSQKTKIFCSVTGPIEPKARQELPTQLALEIIVRPSLGVPNTREKLIEDKLRAVFTPLITRYLYPRQLCQITLQILSSGESEQEFTQREVANSINATLLALIDAGIALNSMCAAISLAISSDDKLIMDPNDEQLKAAKSVHVLALELVESSTVVKNVLLLDSYGDFNEKQLFDILEQGEISLLKLGKEIRSIVESKIINSNLIIQK